MKIKGLLLMAVTLNTGGVFAQNAAYPAKPVRIVVPSSPGGGTDILARIVAQKLTRKSGPAIRRRESSRRRPGYRHRSRRAVRCRRLFIADGSERDRDQRGDVPETAVRHVA
jgi:hypothetical protein